MNANGMREIGFGLGATMFLAMCAGLFYWVMAPNYHASVGETKFFVIDVAVGLAGIVLAAVSAAAWDDL